MSAPLSHTHTRCEFRTAQELQLTPLGAESAEYFLNLADLGCRASLPERPRSGVRVRLELPRRHAVRQAATRRRCASYLGGLPDVAMRLHELLCGACVGVLAGATGRADDAPAARVRSSVRPVGFEDDEAMLPVQLARRSRARGCCRSTSPSRSASCSSTSAACGRCWRPAPATSSSCVPVLDRHVRQLEGAVEAGELPASTACPAINLFAQRADRLAHRRQAPRVPRRAGAHGAAGLRGVRRPLGDRLSRRTDGDGAPLPAAVRRASRPSRRSRTAYYSVCARAAPAFGTARSREGPALGLRRTEVYLSLVDAARAPYPGDLRQLGVATRCTNRDLPLLHARRAGAGRLHARRGRPLEARSASSPGPRGR